MLDGFVTAVTFKTLDMIIPDRSLDEQQRYNDAMIAIAQREKNEARQSEIETRIRLAKRPTLKYQPSKTFNDVRSTVMVALGISCGFAVNKIL